MLSEDVPERSRHGDSSDAGLRLRLPEGHRAADLDELAINADRVAKEIDVVEGEANQLPPAQPHVASG